MGKQSTNRSQPRKGEAEPRKKRAEATIVRGHGTDDEVRARCRADVPGWDELPPHTQDEMVGLMRRFESLQDGPEYRVGRDDSGLTIAPKAMGESDATLSTLRLAEAMGSRDPALLDVRISDLISFRGQVGEENLATKRLNADLAFVRGGCAENPVQSALLVQMAATHDGAMRAMRAAWSADFAPQMQSYGNLATKLFGLYARQAETLAKLQRGGEQVIKHVHIDNRGGQAVVTDQVVARGGMNVGSEGQPYGQGALGPAMLGYDAAGHGVPVASDEGQEAMPDTRGSAGVGRAEGQA